MDGAWAPQEKLEARKMLDAKRAAVLTVHWTLCWARCLGPDPATARGPARFSAVSERILRLAKI
ncbi:MAG: hypothetical protein ACXW4U_08150 [Anaerolineales bacterium]